MLEVYLLLFCLGAILIWFSGKRLVLIVDYVCEEKGLGKAYLGALLLGGVTSLPEISTTLIAASLGDAELAASNLIGGVSMQTAMLAIADTIILKKALTFIVPNPTLIMGGVLLNIQLAYLIACLSIGEKFEFINIGFFSLGTFIIYLLCLKILRSYEKKDRWAPVDYPEDPKRKASVFDKQNFQNRSMTFIVFLICIYSLIVFLGGSSVSYSAHNITKLTFLKSSFLGATFVALATSLPEFTTTVIALKLGVYTLAVSNVFGSNLLMVGLIFVADIFYRDGLILDQSGNSIIYLAALGILVTSVYLWGLLERKNHQIFRMGVDSFLVLIIQSIGLILLFVFF